MHDNYYVLLFIENTYNETIQVEKIKINDIVGYLFFLKLETSFKHTMLLRI